LWRIDKAGVISPIGPLPQGPWVQVNLDQTAEQVFAQAQELAVSLEPLGSRPAVPGQTFIYRGLCAKLWK
jgi:anti-sigma-K factor RskA